MIRPKISRQGDRGGTYEGRTDGFKLVNFTGGPGLEGKFVNVRITDSNTFSLTGEVVD